MPKTFHDFLYLPAELRQQIWKYAIRDDRPGINVFGIYDVDGNMNSGDSLRAIFSTYFSWSNGARIRLCRPKRLPRRHERRVNFEMRKITSSLWKADNHSTYLVDGGLWTACKESRMIMESWVCAKRECTEMAPSTSYFIGYDRFEPFEHYFTTLPHQDLFILQPFFQDVNWRSKPYCLDTCGGSKLADFTGMNIGIEINTLWSEAMDELGSGDPLDDFLYALRAVSRSTRIWLIDYGLKRIREDDPENQSRQEPGQVFYHGDRRFVECDVWDVGSKWGYEDGAWRGTGARFCKKLDIRTNEEMMEGTNYPPLRLLACEYV